MTFSAIFKYKEGKHIGDYLFIKLFLGYIHMKSKDIIIPFS
jgi:hypothetical protein